MNEALGGEVSRDLEDAISTCSFCGRAEDLVGPLIGGEKAHICEDCVEACNALLEEDRQHRFQRMLDRMPRPREVRAHLDRYLVGQGGAKKTLAVAVYNHYKRLLWRSRGSAPEIAKSNILLVGPSGTGKSYMAASLARALEVPFVSVDATRLTAAGYNGDDAETIIQRLLSACGDDPERAGRGIVYLDEIDKLAARAAGGSTARDVAGEGAQQGLLKLLEGTRVTLQAQGKRRRSVTVDTRDVLFICGGAFDGIDRLIERRVAPVGAGFTARVCSSPEGASLDPEPADLQHYGLIPELVGRLPVISVLQPLDEDTLVRVLTEPDNALVKQYRAMLAEDGCELVFTDEALRVVARRALERGVGARGLRAVLEEILLEPMYSVPAAGGEVARLTIDAEAAEGGAPIYEFISSVRATG